MLFSTSSYPLGARSKSDVSGLGQIAIHKGEAEGALLLFLQKAGAMLLTVKDLSAWLNMKHSTLYPVGGSGKNSLSENPRDDPVRSGSYNGLAAFVRTKPDHNASTVNTAIAS